MNSDLCVLLVCRYRFNFQWEMAIHKRSASKVRMFAIEMLTNVMTMQKHTLKTSVNIINHLGPEHFLEYIKRKSGRRFMKKNSITRFLIYFYTPHRIRWIVWDAVILSSKFKKKNRRRNGWIRMLHWVPFDKSTNQTRLTFARIFVNLIEFCFEIS